MPRSAKPPAIERPLNSSNSGSGLAGLGRLRRGLSVWPDVATGVGSVMVVPRGVVTRWGATVAGGRIACAVVVGAGAGGRRDGLGGYRGWWLDRLGRRRGRRGRRCGGRHRR